MFKLSFGGTKGKPLSIMINVILRRYASISRLLRGIYLWLIRDRIFVCEKALF